MAESDTLGHINLKRSFGRAWMRSAAFLDSEDMLRNWKSASACANHVSGSSLSYWPISNGLVSCDAAEGGVECDVVSLRSSPGPCWCRIRGMVFRSKGSPVRGPAMRGPS